MAASGSGRLSDLITGDRLKKPAFGVLLALVAAVTFSQAIFAHPENWGIQDWDQHRSFHEVAARSIADHGEVPLWNPYACGGMVMLANPQSRVVTPFLPLHLVLGVSWALRVEIVLHLALALIGMFLFARRQGLTVLPAALAASVFAFGSSFTANLVIGHSWYLNFAYVPWVAYFLSRGIEHRRNVWGAAAALALMIGGGGAYVLTITLLYVFVATALRVRQLGVRIAAQRLFELGGLTLALGAVKFLPALEFMRTFPRPTEDEYSGYSLSSLAHGVLRRAQSVDDVPWASVDAEGFVSGWSFWMDEQAAYVGVFGIALLLLGLVWTGRRHWRHAVVLAVFLWLSLGQRAPISLWALLHQLPIFDSMRVAQRFRIVWLLMIALFVGLGVQALSERVGRWTRRDRWGTGAAALLLALVTADLALVSVPLWRDAFPIPPRPPTGNQEFHHESERFAYDANGPMTEETAHQHGAWSGLMVGLNSNFGLLECHESANVAINAKAADAPGYRGEAYLEEAEGSVDIRGRTFNTIQLAATLADPGYVVVNMNYYDGWRASTGSIVDLGGLIAVELPAGTHEVELTFRSRTFVAGLAITLATCAAGVWLWLRRRARGRPAAADDEKPA